MLIRMVSTALILTLALTARAEDMPIPELTTIAFRPVETQTYDVLARGRDLEQARAAYAAQNYTQAASIFTLLLARGEDTAFVRLHLAESHLALGQTQAAEPHFLALPYGSERQTGLALIDFTQGTLADPEVTINAALETNLNEPRLWLALGEIYDGQGRFIEAQDVYIHAMQLGISPDQGINAMGMSLLKQGDLIAAKNKFRQAFALSPNIQEYDLNARLVTALTDGPDTAVFGMEDSAAAQLLYDAGLVALTRGDRSTATDLFERALNISPVYFAAAAKQLEMIRTS